MILMIDNYDSFTYNLYQLIGTLYSDIKVIRNDEITIEEIEKMKPEALIISPGPGYPADAGISVEAIRRFSGEIPILGICLGHQAIAEAFGGKIIRAKMPMHGKGTEISINTDCPIFAGLPEKVTSARYHSLVVDVISLPVCLRVTATDGDGQIMALRHKEHPTYGVQFHPESILTEHGAGILSAFLCDVAGIKNADREVISMPKEKRTAL
ncbi:MAG: aminodeoxychorismate/anthranilate synthase component II, partial [Oscillospiraceae bacterium]|nr:aminodeoxychorismate/anthranilate synthase component II [Oscillospiraceae bacterium]